MDEEEEDEEEDENENEDEADSRRGMEGERHHDSPGNDHCVLGGYSCEKSLHPLIDLNVPPK